jgi:hypothetical protein
MIYYYFKYYKIFNFFKKLNISNNQQKYKNIILVDFFDDYMHIYSYSLILSYLRKKYNANVEWFNFLPWLNFKNFFFYEPANLLKYLFKLFFGNIKFLNLLYYSLGTKCGVSVKDFVKYEDNANRISKRLFKKIKNKNDIYKIKIENFTIGNYIYQTYLRYNTEATVCINDLRLLEKIKEAILIYFSFKNYLKKNKVKVLIVSHAFYNYWGLVASYASKNNVKVIRIKTTGWRKNTNFQIVKIYKELVEESFPYHLYKKIFDKFDLKNKFNNLKIGKKILLQRLKGKIDPQLLGNISSYSNNKVNIKFDKKKENILVFANCFFDGPGRFKNFIFSDFYEWIIFTLDNAAKTNFQWYVKPHPKAQPGNSLIFNELIQKYKNNKNIIFLKKNISNNILINLGFKSLFCHHGNATAEFAFKKIPVVNCCENTMSDYNFFLKCNTKKDYLKAIKSANKINLNINNKEIYEWVYMHFYHFLRRKENRILSKNFENKNLHIHNPNSNNVRNKKIFNFLIENYNNNFQKVAINELIENDI